MPPKGRKKRDSKDSTSSNGGSGEGDDKKKKESDSKKKSSGGKSLGCDIFNDAAMENAYYVCHNVQVSEFKSKSIIYLIQIYLSFFFLFIILNYRMY